MAKITMNDLRTELTEEEIAELEGYMMDNLPTLKHRASEINPIKAMMKD